MGRVKQNLQVLQRKLVILNTYPSVAEVVEKIKHQKECGEVKWLVTGGVDYVEQGILQYMTRKRASYSPYSPMHNNCMESLA